MKNINQNTLFALSLILSLVIVTAVASLNQDFQYKTETRLKTFSSYEELRNFLNASQQVRYPPYDSGWRFGAQPGFFRTLSAETSGGQSDVPDYSLTNIQVEGVDEADIVKTDGTHIYIVSNRRILIVKAYPPTEAEILSQIEVDGTITGLFINNDKLVLFEDTGYYNEYRLTDKTPAPVQYYTRKAHIKVYNIIDKTNPALKRTVTVEGSYLNSRMIGDYIYTIINEPIYAYSNEIELPKIYIDDQAQDVLPTQIYYSNTTDRYDTYTHVIAINALKDQEKPTQKTFLLGWTSTMYVSPTNIYLTYSTWPMILLEGNNGYTQEETSIHRIRIDNGNIEYKATGEVPGYALNQFSMDEHNDHFRIATTTGEVWGWGEATSRNHVYILNMDLNIVGRLEDLAPGEKIYSAKFMGNRAYLVTFKKIDPLFVLDLSVPTDPQVLGQLKITGYSDYLHPYDETHIIGIGKETVEAEEGNFAWYQGVKISLFDVTDVANPKEVAKYEIGDRGTDSPILHDHKAFLFDKAKNLLVIPVTVAEINPAKYPGGQVPPYAYGDFVFDGTYVFNISLEEGLVLKGRITHMANNEELIKSGYYFQSEYSVKRSLYIDNVLYTISGQKIKMNSLSDLSQINEIVLNP